MESIYPNLRQVLDPSFEGLSDADIDAAFADAFGEGVTPAEYEEFFGGIAKAFQKAAPTIANVAQGALKGGTSGGMLGPIGAIGGAVLGGTSAALGQTRSPVARGIGGALGQLTGGSPLGGAAGSLLGLGQQALMGRRPSAGQLFGAGTQLLGQRSPAAAQLVNTLSRPETRRALASLASGRNPGIPLGPGGIRIPANAFAGLLGALGREAEAESLSLDSDETVPGYLMDGYGHLAADPAIPEQRAARVLQLIRESDEAEFVTDIADRMADWTESDDADDAAFDEYLDSAEWWAA